MPSCGNLSINQETIHPICASAAISQLIRKPSTPSAHLRQYLNILRSHTHHLRLCGNSSIFCETTQPICASSAIHNRFSLSYLTFVHYKTSFSPYE
ncbi:MAG: hypothetical protein M9959_12130 [Chitinophagaceae bacterium]|nr:hypothetical protein [Chitinophagaceae bacterium]